METSTILNNEKQTNFIDLDSNLEKKNIYDSFLIYMCVDGKVEVVAEDSKEIISKGETILVPASVKHFKLNSHSAKLLEVYV